MIPVVLALLLAGAALAQDDVSTQERARQLFDEGAAAYEAGRYEAAIPLWEESWRLSLQPLILYNLSNAHERMGNLELALEYIERYRQQAPLDEQPLLEQRIDALQVRVAAIEAERDRTAAEQARREAERLVERQQLVQQSQQAGSAVERSRSPAGWIVGGVGVAALATGVAFTAAAGRSRSQVAAYCDDDGLCSVDSEPWVARNRTHRALAWTGLGVGAVSVGVGGVLLAVPLDGRGVGLSLGGRW
jgi:tetratricopeptide (TPR) repeat protein